MRSWLFLINYYAHDFFSSFWLASFVTILVIHTATAQIAQPPVESALIRDLLHLFFRLQSLSLILIMATGYIRYLDSRERLQKEKEKQRKNLLVIKHILMAGVLIGGTSLGVMWAYSY